MLKIKFRIAFQFFLGLAVLTSCSKADKISGPLISFTIPSGGYKIEVGKSLSLNPNVVNDEKTTYTWGLSDNDFPTSIL